MADGGLHPYGRRRSNGTIPSKESITRDLARKAQQRIDALLAEQGKPPSAGPPNIGQRRGGGTIPPADFYTAGNARQTAEAIAALRAEMGDTGPADGPMFDGEWTRVDDGPQDQSYNGKTETGHDGAQARAEKPFIDFEPLPGSEADDPADVLPLSTISDLLNREPPEWEVEGLLPATSLIAIIGPPKEGKTFFALDIGLCRAYGLDWRGRTVTPGPVLYVMAEGQSGAAKRVQAWLEHEERQLQDQDAPFLIYDRPVNFHDAAQVRRLIRTVQALWQRYRIRPMVVIDTLSRCFGGENENGPSEMGRFIAATDDVRTYGRSTVVVVHHTGKDKERGSRGHSSFLGAVDVELVVSKHKEKGLHSVVVNNGKDIPEGQEFWFRLEGATVTNAKTGAAMHTCRVVEVSNPAASEALENAVWKGLSENSKRAAYALEKANNREATAMEIGKAAKLSNSSVYSSLKNLEAQGLVCKVDGMYRCTPEFRKHLTEKEFQSLES